MHLVRLYSTGTFLCAQPSDQTLNDLSAYNEEVAKHIKGVISKVK